MDIKKRLESYKNIEDGLSFGQFLLGKDTILKLGEVERINRIRRANGSENKLQEIILTGEEVEALFKVCPELDQLRFQFLS